ncbi:Abi family protein [Sciscionella marina]|uniref:Abi family protein n=1 Tax=Sciscionella marina TaxID=508770 RepID=UPI00037B33E5|nr:Abi family protein [Sciscionella marina]
MEPKPHLTYPKQLELLKKRGMLIDNATAALALLQRTGYYTLSGYWYPFRVRDADGVLSDQFRLGTSITWVQALWEFDNRLRSATFVAIQHVETYLRALLAYALGAIDPMVHRKPGLLSIDRAEDYPRWLDKLDRKVRESRDDFVVHHRENRQGVIPVWVATDVLDWGGLSYLYSFAPPQVRADVAARFQLNAAQLKSWFKALNVVRNVCAHHGRFFNRYYSLTPKLPLKGKVDSLDAIGSAKSTTFAMPTLLQYLGSHTTGTNMRILPAVVRTFPKDAGMIIGALGTPDDWETLPLWK